MNDTRLNALREAIRTLVAEYHQAAFPSSEFKPGETPVPVAGRVFDAGDIQNLVDASLDFWLTTGRFANQFERDFAGYLEVRFASLVNSGSSANLLAVSSLTSPKLGPRQLRPGDEVITVAAGFPTTVAPIVQNQLVPVFVDVSPPTYNIRTDQLEAALSPRSRAIILAHTLGNPFDVEAVVRFARENGLWLIEDCCDALGSTFRGRKTGTFGDLATFSFYPAHHITMGEGGCVVTGNPMLKTIVESFRDWGRDCWCDPGKDNTCGKRFEWKHGQLPAGYDHKYVYSHLGYNLKLTDMQAAVGVTQLVKLASFIDARRRNFEFLRRRLEPLSDLLLLPEATPGSDPSWFGFPIGVRPAAPFKRDALTQHLNSRRIATRLLFSGNLLRQPAMDGVCCRVAGDLSGSDFVMRNVFWIGVYPGLTTQMLDYTAESILEYCRGSAPR